MKMRKQQGLASVEFALILPVFVLMMLGMMEYGYYFYVDVSAQNAAREAARSCTLTAPGNCTGCTNSSVDTVADTYMGNLGLASYTTATVACTFPQYTVTVSVDFPTLTGYLNGLGLMPSSSTSGNTKATGIAVMRGQ